MLITLCIILYRDIRKSVDLCHRDGVIKEVVAKDPGATTPLRLFMHLKIYHYNLLRMLLRMSLMSSVLYPTGSQPRSYAHETERSGEESTD